MDQAAAAPPALLARRLVRRAVTATLATRLKGQEGWPYASLVLLAVDHDGSPLLLMSRLAEHTRNLDADSRVSLLVTGDFGGEDPLTSTRVTIQGRASPSAEARHRARFVARHPSAQGYAGFGDFSVWRVAVERVHLVAGFGRIHWIDGQAFRAEAPLALAMRETDIVSHMNSDHPDAVQLYATRLLGLGEGAWRMIGIDPEGVDLHADGRLGRLDFEQPVADADQARAELVKLAKDARRG
ncbi:MAG: HugZ family protein [Alphaproteobacteria bacterium]|nr:HugZ family protein [Alphaproteobacteria bacterium]